MPAIFKNLSRMFSGHKGNPELHLAVFGKHPAWNDHIDDLGLDTAALVEAKKLLYAQGINKNIDSGAWDTLPADHRLERFDHKFLWHMPPVLIAGELHASADGKGRDKYPLVLALQFENLPDNFAADAALPFLTELHQRLAGAGDEAAFRVALEAAAGALPALAEKSPAASALTANALAALAANAELRPAEQGFHRIIYQLAHGIPAYSLYAKNSGAKTLSPRPHHLRAPTGGMNPSQALLFYLRLSLALLDPAANVLVIASERGDWVDILVGEPAAANFFCLKAGLPSLPRTSDIPYTLPGEFVASIDAFLKTCAAAPAEAPLPEWPAL